MPAYLVAGSGQIKSKKRTEPAHEIKIIQQTVVVNKNPNSPPSRPSQSQSQKPISGTNQKNTPSNALSQRASGRRMGRFRSGSVHSASTGVASLPNGVHILPNLHWLRSSAVRNALRRPSSPPGSRTKMSQTQFKGSSSNGNAQAQTSLSAQQNINPTDIIIYRNGQKQPIVIRTSGHVTLSKTKAANGKSNIVISKTPSKTIANPSTTTTLKPGEDPPEPENEVAVRWGARRVQLVVCAIRSGRQGDAVLMHGDGFWRSFVPSVWFEQVLKSSSL